MISAMDFVGDLVAGNMQMFPVELDMVFKSNETVQHLIYNLFGASVGALVYQEIALSDNRRLLANRRVICLSAAAAGALATHLVNRLPKGESEKRNLLSLIFLINQGVNGILAVRSICKGHYAFGASALVSTYMAFNF